MNNCIDCKKTITLKAKRCCSCETKRKHKEGIVDSHKTNFKDGSSIVQHYCIDCRKSVCDCYTQRCRKCRDKYYRGNKSPSFGKITRKINHWNRYKNIWMRSTWEVKYAQYLDKRSVKWQYEPKTFDLGNTTYTPDFYLPKSDTYVEIKGYWYKKSKQKFYKMKRIYPNIAVFLLNQFKLKKLGIIE